MPLFDAYIFVDWSAVNVVQPQQETHNAVWSGESIPQINYQLEKYHPTRRQGFIHVTEFLVEQVKQKRRVLIGFDFPYGYPSGFAKALNHSTGAQSWWKIWEELACRIVDTPNNENNRFIVAADLNEIAGDGKDGPFWGCPVGVNIVNLQPTSPGFPFPATGGVSLQQYRLVEMRLDGVQETWGLFGAGRVGSQTLVGLPYLFKLRKHPDLEIFSQVWPFETQFTKEPSVNQGPFVLHAEIWPGIVKERVKVLMDDKPDLIRDKAQVRAMCEWAAELDAQDALGDYFAQPSGLTSKQIRACIEEEGWILGAK